jgi:protein TonB
LIFEPLKPNVQHYEFIQKQKTKQDSLPPLASFKEQDIDSVWASFRDKSITIRLKNGEEYTYIKPERNYEENLKMPKKIRNALLDMTIVFTKAEYPPLFPGGEKSWNQYMHEFCKVHKEAIQESGSGSIVVQFIVDNQGDLFEVKTISEDQSKLAQLAVEAVKKSPRWIPATQNGRKVVCYYRQLVKLRL